MSYGQKWERNGLDSYKKRHVLTRKFTEALKMLSKVPCYGQSHLKENSLSVHMRNRFTCCKTASIHQAIILNP